MKFFPYKNYILTTNLTAEEVRRRLQDNIEPKKMFRFNFFHKSVTKPYEGEIHANTFCMNRIIEGRNSFLPLIEGKISKDGIGTEVRIKMRMALYTYIVWLIILGTLISLIFKVASLMILRKQFHPGSIALLVFTVLIYLFAVLSFNSESSKSKRFFEDLFIYKI